MRAYIGVALLVAAAILVLGANLYWWEHPDLTQMQMFREMWAGWVGAILFGLLGAGLLESAGKAR